MKKILFTLLIVSFIFFRFWDIENRMQFTWDQVSNAWVMKDILVDGKWPSEGMVAKLNSPIHIGPFYYYLLVPFYWIFQLEPVGAGVFAAIVALVTVCILFYIARRMFSSKVALIALGIYTFSTRIIIQDRIAWPVIFLPMLALGVFYSLYRLFEGKSAYLLLLAFCLGFSLHIHFTGLFFFFYALLCLPFFVKTKGFAKYGALSLGILLIWAAPVIFRLFGSGNASRSAFSYFQTYYHGLHAVRVFQLLPDALIEFVAIIGVPQMRMLGLLALPIFLFVFLRANKRKVSLPMAYLTSIWFIVPLFVFSVYSGEISDYYFTVTRPIAVLVMAYLTYKLIATRHTAILLAVILFWGYALSYNTNVFFRNNFGNHVPKIKQEVKEEISKGGRINFTEGDPKSYFYYLYAEREK